MATNRLVIYNGALLLCRQRRLASLTENQESRHDLDLVWNDGGVRHCLEQAQWHFAMRSTRLDYDPGIDPQWGYRRAFPKPDDWVATSALCVDEYFRSPLLAYSDEAAYWYADYDQIYVKYVSDHADWGGDMSKWPYTFVEYVKAYFASRVVGKLSGDKAVMDYLLHPKTGLVAERLRVAKNRAAMTGPTTFPVTGAWANARAGQRSGWKDGGNTGSLIG